MTKRWLAAQTLLAATLIALWVQRIPVSSAVQESPAFARIAYGLEMSQPASHLFEVTISVDASAGQVPPWIDFQMPKWQPGRYAVADFAKNVQEFSAKSGTRSLSFSKTDEQTWRVETAGNPGLSVSYKVFSNDLSGTFAQLDSTHGNYNGGEMFMYVAGHKQNPVELQIYPPAGWRAINGSSDRPNQTAWKFPNYEMLIDNPTEIGPDWTLDEFNQGGKSYRVVVHSRADEGGRRPDLVRDVQKIVAAQTSMWGTPDFDHYTFLFHFAGDGRSFDGMEHLTSTQIINGYALADPFTYESVVGTAAHEFFHVWNVKRLRPVEFGPWDWTRPVNTKSLWIAEGLTEYYGEMTMHRAGLWSDSRLLETLSQTITDVENTPGIRLMSAVDASLAAPFLDATVHRQRTNLANSAINYYTKGELIGLVLDLLIRGRTNGSNSLDDVLRKMYDEFYLKAPNASYYLKGKGYTDEDFVRVLSEVAGTDMGPFYERHIRGVEALPYDEAFTNVGLILTKTPSEEYSDGLTIDPTDRQNLRLGAIRPGLAAQRAGLEQGDILLSIGGNRVNRDNWRAQLDRYGPGDRVPVQARRFDRTVELTMELGQPVAFDYQLTESANASEAARRLREAWLAGK